MLNLLASAAAQKVVQLHWVKAWGFLENMPNPFDMLNQHLLLA